MPRRDGGSRRSSPLVGEEAEAVGDAITDMVARLSPKTRLRLVAFLHLLDKPETASATFEVSEAGLMRLTLAGPTEPGATAIN
jgi:hypothetical protein